MAYSGSTASSSVANPARLLIGSFAKKPISTGLSTDAAIQHSQGGNLWFYSSTNPTATITGAGFFSDGKALGMTPGDIVMGNHFTSAGSSVITFAGSITAITTAGAATMSTGGSYTSTHV